MGTVLELEPFRRKGTVPTTTGRPPADRSDPHPDYALFNKIEGRCPGCGARRSHMLAFHDTGTERLGMSILSKTLPHFMCDGERVTQQDVVETPGSDT